MNTRWLLTFTLVVIAACSREESTAQKAGPPDGDHVPSTEGRSVRTEPAAMAEQGTWLKARAVLRTGDAKSEGNPMDIALRLMEDSRVFCTANADDVELKGYGYHRQGAIRVWLEGKDDTRDRVRQGLLVGSKHGDRFEGTFAISGNGGTPAFTGSWASVD